MKRTLAPDVCRHLSLCAVGGFFGMYAISLVGHLASAQTNNLLELLLALLRGNWRMGLMCLGCLAIYIAGTMLPVLLRHFLHGNAELASLVIDAAACLLLPFTAAFSFPLSLYPIFFAVSVQWSAFTGAQGFVSSSIFSTNNTKQAALGVADYLCDRDKTHLVKTRFYCLALLFFHLGAAIGFCAVRFFGCWGSLLNLPLIAAAAVMVKRESFEAKCARLRQQPTNTDTVTAK